MWKSAFDDGLRIPCHNAEFTTSFQVPMEPRDSREFFRKLRDIGVFKLLQDPLRNSLQREVALKEIRLKSLLKNSSWLIFKKIRKNCF